MAGKMGAGGPKTAAGKRNSSLNALVHGYYAKSRHGLREVAKAVGKSYKQTLAEMRDCYKPDDAVEEVLVRRIARCAWRILYAHAMEDRNIQHDGVAWTVSSDQQCLIRYERLTDIQLHRAIEALHKRREAKQKGAANELLSAPAPSVAQAQP